MLLSSIPSLHRVYQYPVLPAFSLETPRGEREGGGEEGEGEGEGERGRGEEGEEDEQRQQGGEGEREMSFKDKHNYYDRSFQINDMPTNTL